MSKHVLRRLALSDESLSKQPLFWLVLLGPLALALLLCLPLWFNADVRLRFTPAGYDDFLNTFKLPIGVWSLSIPLVAIVAHMHRTL